MRNPHPTTAEKDASANTLQRSLLAAQVVHSCLNCEHFVQEPDKCTLYKTMPPAKVIYFGCPSWEGEIPF